jgi:vitamin B12 transporter
MNKLFCTLVVATAVTVPPLTAADDVPSNAVFVTATRTAITTDAALATVVVITRAEIEAAQAKDLAELLRFHAGLDIGRNGGIGQNTSVFMRGTESNHTLVLIDGVRINPGTIGGAPLQYLHPDVIDRIEIVRGPRSTLYGSDAIGGVIQIFTRRPEGTSARLLGGGGSNETREAALGAHHNAANWRFGADVSHLRTDGFPARVGATTDSGHRNTTINAYTGYKAGKADIELSRWQARGNTEYFDFALTPQDQDFENSTSAVALKTPIASNWATTLKLSQMLDRVEQNQSSDFISTRRNVLDWQNDVQLNNEHLLTVGALLSREHTQAQSFGTGFDVDTDSDAVFAQDQWRFGAQRLLTALRLTDHETFGDHTTGELAYGIDLSKATNVYASYATGFRAPDSTDRFGFGGNPNLDPETSRNVELGAKFSMTPNQRLNVALFQNDVDNLITFVDPDGFLGPTPGANQNVEQARIRGLEAGYGYTAKPWGVDIKGVVQDPENRQTGRQLARRAKRSLTSTVRYATGSYSVGASVLATSERPDSDFNTTVNRGYGVVDVFAQYRMTKSWLVRGRVENVFDKQYTLANSFNAPDRALYLQIEYQYKSN